MFSTYNLFPKVNDREININEFKNIIFIDNYLYYPEVYLYYKDSENIIKPINEETQSLKNVKKNNNISINQKSQYNIYTEPLFFMIYNFDNYYHYLYDTLPYLISYLRLKEKIPTIKLLCNYPNKNKKEFYKFNLEFLELLNIYPEDIVIVDSKKLYEKIYVSDSYTHNRMSNHPPRIEIYELYQKIKSAALNNNCKINIYDNIYISRRTHVHNKLDNIGTNYTQRRKLMNEDYLVEELKKNNYQEIFTENLTTIEKIYLFHNAKNIIGLIGGGIANVVFSEKKTKLYAIISPYFLDINSRFKYCLNQVDVKYIDNTYHNEYTEFKKYMRVQELETNIIGEIENVYSDKVKIKYSKDNLAGWNSDLSYNYKMIANTNITKLDNGLNCSFVLDIDKLTEQLDNIYGVVCFNQGWTDIILCIGLVFYYLEKYNQIILIIRDDSKSMIDFIFRNVSNINIRYISKDILDNNESRCKIFNQYQNKYDLLIHGSYGYNYGYYKNIKFEYKKGISKHFYKDYGIEEKLSYQNFNIERDIKLEEIKYQEAINNFGENYIVVMNDKKRDFVLSHKYIKYMHQFNLINCSDICFDTIKILEKSKEIHIFSSFWSLIIYNLQKKYNLFENNNIFFHDYVRANYYSELYINNQWKTIKNKRVGVCLIGGLRDDTIKNFENHEILDNLTRCFNLNDENVDLFIFNNCNQNINNKLKKHFGNRIKFIESYQQHNIHHDNKLLHKKNLINEEIFNTNNNLYNQWRIENKEYLSKLSNHISFKNINKEIPRFRSFHQYYQLNKVLEEIKKYEEENKFKYNFIMKIRMDFFLKENSFSPNHYFQNNNDILFKDYDNLKSLYDKINEDDNYHHQEFRVNNYLYYRTTKYLGGQFVLNQESYNRIRDKLEDKEAFNNEIENNFFITINDACFFASRNNFYKVIGDLYNNYSNFYDSNIKFWWTAEAQLHLSILKNNCFYLDYIQGNNYYYGIDMWINDIHGLEKFNNPVNRVAVCLIGHYRQKTIDKFETDKILYNLDRSFGLSNKNTDIFIFNNCDQNINNKFKIYFKDRIKFVESLQEDLDFHYSEMEKIKRERPSDKYNKNVEKFNKWKKMNKEYLNKVSDSRIFTIEGEEIPRFHGLIQHYQLNLALDEVVKFEKVNNFKYDFIMKIRMDFFFKNKSFGPNHYFNDTNDILFKDYDSLKY